MTMNEHTYELLKKHIYWGSIQGKMEIYLWLNITNANLYFDTTLTQNENFT